MMLTEWQVGWMFGQDDVSGGVWLKLEANPACFQGWIDARQDVWDAFIADEQLATSSQTQARLPLS